MMTDDLAELLNGEWPNCFNDGFQYAVASVITEHLAAERVTSRSVDTGHRVRSPAGGDPKPTRALPWWVWPLEHPARWRARLEGRYG